MTIRSTDWFVAAGHVFANGTLEGGRGAVTSRIGVGHYRIVLDREVDEAERCIVATIHETVGNASITTHEVDDKEFHVHTWIVGGASDRDFDFLVVRFAP